MQGDGELIVHDLVCILALPSKRSIGPYTRAAGVVGPPVELSGLPTGAYLQILRSR